MRDQLPPPLRSGLSLIQKLVATYKLWHEYISNFPRTLRYTLGVKIDFSFIDTIEYIFIASYLPNQEKLPVLAKSITKLDLVKFFLQIAWELHALDNRKYITISEKLDEVGRMLGGWKKGLEKKTLTR